ncbi:MAG TPA: hypothetical protein VKQ70_14090 [Caulobacteraceae bacterium]|nr:hypothetical protein [Caulobacteraceae bacterium]
MISVLVMASGEPSDLTRLLTALVPAAADGLVRDVAVIGASGPALAIADDAGAQLYAAFGEALAQAKGPWVAGLPAGANFASDWMERLTAHLVKEPQTAARLVARGFSLPGGPEGWLAPKRLAGSPVVEHDLQRLARRGRRLRVLERR